MLLSASALARTSPMLLAAAACSAAPSPGARDSVPFSASVPAPAAASAVRPDSTGPVPAPASAEFTRIMTQQTSAFDESAELVIRDRPALESAWARVFNQVQSNPPPAVDFGREMVILVALGNRNSGGYTIRVDAVNRSSDGAVVRYVATSPGPGCMTMQSMTSPVDVVRAPRIPGTIRFQRRDIVQTC